MINEGHEPTSSHKSDEIDMSGEIEFDNNNMVGEV